MSDYQIVEQKCDRCGDTTGPFLVTDDANGRRIICAKTCKGPDAGSEHSNAGTTAAGEITGGAGQDGSRP